MAAAGTRRSRNIWNIDEAGNPVSLAQAAPQGGVVASNPIQAQRQQAELGGAQLGNARTAQQMALDAAKVPYADQMAQTDAQSPLMSATRRVLTSPDSSRAAASSAPISFVLTTKPCHRSRATRRRFLCLVRAFSPRRDAAGDLNLIYAYAKVMDPNSVVREGEQASVAGGDTWINAKTAQLQKQLGQGGTFKPEYRKRLREEMAGRMGELNQSFIADRVRYKGIADRFMVNPQDVVGEHPGARFQEVSERVLGRKQQQLDYNVCPSQTADRARSGMTRQAS